VGGWRAVRGREREARSYLEVPRHAETLQLVERFKADTSTVVCFVVACVDRLFVSFVSLRFARSLFV
jgi:hypothetical protein